MTWNIHGGVGVDGKRDLERITALVRRHDPDIVALQEVDSRARSTSNAFEMLTECLGGNGADVRLIEAPDGDYGHMLISRWPFSEIRLHSLSVDRREPRAAIEAWVDTPAGALHLVAAHLGLGLLERKDQARRLAHLVESAPRCTVMFGDFNDWIRVGSVRRTLSRTFRARTAFRTFPSAFPLFKLDRIYCRPEGLMRSSFIDRSDWRASDHLPLVADLDAAWLRPDAARGG